MEIRKLTRQQIQTENAFLAGIAALQGKRKIEGTYAEGYTRYPSADVPYFPWSTDAAVQKNIKAVPSERGMDLIGTAYAPGRELVVVKPDVPAKPSEVMQAAEQLYDTLNPLTQPEDLPALPQRRKAS